MNPDIKEEREKIGFNVEEFTKWYYGGADKAEERRFLANYFLDDPELQNPIGMSYMSHEEKYVEAIRRSVIMLKKIQKLKSEGRAPKDINDKVMNGLSMTGIIPQGTPLVTHTGMFVSGIENLGTPEQQAEYVSRAENYKITGTYAQTELGHGTFVRGLETTATFDPTSKEFVVHSPSIRAYKWWPGGLGLTANHAIVFAQLYTKGKCHGVQPFIIQLRDSETHKPMKGIIIGEIGPKVGFNTVNNGFLGFDNVRIPRKNMLMKYSKVEEDGNFVKIQSSVLSYGTMTYVRVVIVRDQASFLSKAATIATRYSLVRRQSPIDPNQPEPKIIEHVTQQMKIFPIIAKVLVIKAAADNLYKMYEQVMADQQVGNFERLPELHALSCCLKALSTEEVAKGVSTCRLACGGHGYLNSAGFNDIYGCVVAAQHYEGDNTVMFLQTARFLMKIWDLALKGRKLTPSVDYLRKYVDRSSRRENWDGSVKGILRAFQSTTAAKVAATYKNLEKLKKTNPLHVANNILSIELAKTADLHCQVFMLQSIVELNEEAGKKVSPSLGFVLRDLLELFSVDLAFRYLGELMQFMDISSDDIETLQKRLEANLQKLRKNAIGIVDGFDFPDKALGSTIGAYDGNVYERLLKAAKSSPLNQEDVNKSFELYLKPFMKSNL